LASWLDARAHQGLWLVRIEDVDQPRCIPGADHTILQQLADCGLVPDAPPVWQSQRTATYQAALDTLRRDGLSYPCACSRKDIESALASQGHPPARHTELVYPGTCRTGLRGKPARAWRFLTDTFAQKVAVAPVEHARAATENIANLHPTVAWIDRRLGAQQQNVAAEVGDFVLLRADGLFAYQLAVVVDDAAQGITHIVRGEDLTDNTARQILLQRALGVPTPAYLHTPLVLGDNGEKLSKQNGARPINTATPALALDALQAAAACLGLKSPSLTDTPSHSRIAGALDHWVQQWAVQWSLPTMQA
jgi:glutamyl-Q tRNA(Asp) synthetase